MRVVPPQRFSRRSAITRLGAGAAAALASRQSQIMTAQDATPTPAEATSVADRLPAALARLD